MDRNLVGENMEISKVYEELSKSISTKYFNFDEVSWVRACGLAGVFSNVGDISQHPHIMNLFENIKSSFLSFKGSQDWACSEKCNILLKKSNWWQANQPIAQEAQPIQYIPQVFSSFLLSLFMVLWYPQIIQNTLNGINVEREQRGLRTERGLWMRPHERTEPGFSGGGANYQWMIILTTFPTR